MQKICSGPVTGAGKNRPITLKNLSVAQRLAKIISTQLLKENCGHVLETLLDFQENAKKMSDNF